MPFCWTMRAPTLYLFFFNDTATTEIYTLSLHDALPILKNINHTRSSISDDIRNILCSSANMRRAIPLILRYGSSHIGATRSEERFSRNAETDPVCPLLLETHRGHMMVRHRADQRDRFVS